MRWSRSLWFPSLESDACFVHGLVADPAVLVGEFDVGVCALLVWFFGFWSVGVQVCCPPLDDFAFAGSDGGTACAPFLHDVARFRACPTLYRLHSTQSRSAQG